ncbi:MAG: adenylyl-sulfate kinase [Proteobacteria bacterium]|nr:adenylyl-sulfate kinase [Pseudomonadota bacterium]
MNSSSESTHIFWHHATVTRPRRESLNRHKGVVLWFTGLPGSGKSTLAHTVEETLHGQGCRTFVLDGDNIRHGLCQDLNFSDKDRSENNRRVGEVCKLFVNAGVIVLAAFVSPFKKDRLFIRNLIGCDDFIEIFCDCSVKICEQRDSKGLYKKARKGLIPNFTGVSSRYETPTAELIIDTGNETLSGCADKVCNYLKMRNIV